MSTKATGAESAVAERTDAVATGTWQQDLGASPVRIPTPALPADRPVGAEPGEPWTDDLYARALRAGRGPLFLRRLSSPDFPQGFGGEEMLPLDVERWCAPLDAADAGVLRRCTGSVLDVGCGPGRLVTALAARGLLALGVDVCPAAVARTRRQGANAVRRSVFDRLPREGRWESILLMDGNVGIGGDPLALLARLRQLVAPGGCLLAEAAGDDVDERLTVRVEDGQGRYGRPFPWARLGTSALLQAADATGWILTGRWTADGRPFLELRRPRGDDDGCGTSDARPGRP